MATQASRHIQKRQGVYHRSAPTLRQGLETTNANPKNAHGSALLAQHPAKAFFHRKTTDFQRLSSQICGNRHCFCASCAKKPPPQHDPHPSACAAANPQTSPAKIRTPVLLLSQIPRRSQIRPPICLCLRAHGRNCSLERYKLQEKSLTQARKFRLVSRICVGKAVRVAPQGYDRERV
jgi:hypothetical protein